MLKKHKKLLIALGLMLLCITDAFASGGGIMAGAGEGARDEVVTTVKGWQWLFAFLPFAVGIGLVVATHNYLETKDEQSNGQSEPKAQRYFKLVLAFIVGIIAVYIVYGVFGMVFAKTTFGGMWDQLVTDFWVRVFGSGGNPTP